MTDPIDDLRAEHTPDPSDPEWCLACCGIDRYPCLPVRALDAAEQERDEWHRTANEAHTLAGRLLTARADAEVERDAAEARVKALEAALVNAALPLEVLTAQIAAKPYREMTDDFQREIVNATRALRAALEGLVPARPAVPRRRAPRNGEPMKRLAVLLLCGIAALLLRRREPEATTILDEPDPYLAALLTGRVREP